MQLVGRRRAPIMRVREIGRKRPESKTIGDMLEQPLVKKDNPLLAPWTGPFEAPPFARIAPAHFRPAFETRLRRRATTSTPIAQNPAPPTFANTIEALERCGRSARSGRERLLQSRRRRHQRRTGGDRARDRADPCRAIAARPISTRRCSPASRRLKAAEAQLGLDAEQARVLERYHLELHPHRRGAAAPKKARLAAIGERLATLGTQFGQNVLADEKAFLLLLEAERSRGPAGLPRRSSGARPRPSAAIPANMAITLSRSSHRAISAILGAARSARKSLPRLGRARRKRRRDRQSRHRRRNGRAARRARAAARLRELRRISASPTRWRRRRRPRSTCCSRSGRRRVARALSEEAALQAIVAAEGGNFTIAPWDWRYYAEKRRKARVRSRRGRDQALSAARPDDRGGVLCRGAAFRPHLRRALDIALYHPDARAWTVSRADGARDRAVHRRLFRAAVKAQRRLDERLPRPAEARRRAVCRSSSM